MKCSVCGKASYFYICSYSCRLERDNQLAADVLNSGFKQKEDDKEVWGWGK